jgi:hypothetical protein
MPVLSDNPRERDRTGWVLSTVIALSTLTGGLLALPAFWAPAIRVNGSVLQVRLCRPRDFGFFLVRPGAHYWDPVGSLDPRETWTFGCSDYAYIITRNRATE